MTKKCTETGHHLDAAQRGWIDYGMWRGGLFLVLSVRVKPGRGRLGCTEAKFTVYREGGTRARGEMRVSVSPEDLPTVSNARKSLPADRLLLKFYEQWKCNQASADPTRGGGRG